MPAIIVLSTCNALCITVASFDPDSEFTVKSLTRLERLGVINLEDLEMHKMQLANAVGIEAADLNISDSSLQLLEMWIKGPSKLRPTWRHFFWALREIKIAHIADHIEHYFSGMMAEQETPSEVDPSSRSEESERREEEVELQGENCKENFIPSYVEH